MTNDTRFWDKIAEKYAASPIKNMPAYEQTLKRTREYLPPEGHALELGCGTGSTALRLADSVAGITGSDISGNMIAIARRKAAEEGIGNARFVHAGLFDDALDATAADAVLAFNLLHLIDDTPRAIERVRDLLKPGAVFISKTPCLARMRWFLAVLLPVLRALGKAPSHVTAFSAEALEAAIARAGFEIVESRVFDGAPHNRFIVARKR